MHLRDVWWAPSVGPALSWSLYLRELSIWVGRMVFDTFFQVKSILKRKVGFSLVLSSRAFVLEAFNCLFSLFV